MAQILLRKHSARLIWQIICALLCGKRCFGTARHNGLKMVVATTNKYSPPGMIVGRLKDEIQEKVKEASTDGLSLAIIPALLQGIWVCANAFARPVPMDKAGNTQPALAALINMDKGLGHIVR